MLSDEEIIKLANDMAFMACIWIEDDSNEFKDMIAFAKLVAEEAAKREREACAKICDELGEKGYVAEGCAKAIRARGDNK